MIKKISIAAMLSFVAASSYAKIEMPKIFSDGMILQRDAIVRVWGKADAGAEITVQFRKQKVKARADRDGKWSVSLQKLWADANPETMSIYENGKKDVEIKDILVGEVWILGGQSNMEFPLQSTTDFKEAKKRANYPQMRYFVQTSKFISGNPQSDSPFGARWLSATPERVGDFSGVGFYFAEKLMKDLDVPVGLIYASKGGTQMFTWIPRQFLSKSEWLREELKIFDRECVEYDYHKAVAAHEAKMAKRNAEIEKAKKEGKKPATVRWDFAIAPLPESPRKPFSSPCMLYNSMVAPIAGYSVRGTLWYQGESDSGGELLEHFSENFAILIDSWRTAFENPDMYFLVVQLAPYKSDFSEARAAQFKTTKLLKNVHMACIADCGEQYDIHPKNKTVPAMRLEKLALNKVFAKKNIIADAPELKSVEYKGDSATVNFETFKSGLEAKGEPRGFEILVDGKWIAPKSLSLDGDSVKVESAGKDIEGVRYLWQGWTVPNVWLYNKAKIPAISFNSKK